MRKYEKTQGNKGCLLRLESSHGLFLKIKLLILCAIPIAAWCFAQDVNLTIFAAGIVFILALVAVFSGKSVYKFYDDCLIVNDSVTEGKNCEVPLLRIGNIAAKHSFFQPKGTGNIFLVLQDVKQPSLTARILGAKEVEVSDNYPNRVVMMFNIRDYEQRVKIIEDIVNKAKNSNKQDSPFVLQGITNVDEMLPWLGNAKQK